MALRWRASKSETRTEEMGAKATHFGGQGCRGARRFIDGPLSVVQEGLGLQINVDHDHPDYEVFHTAQKAQIDETPTVL